MLKCAWNPCSGENRDLNTDQAPVKLVRQGPDKYFCVKHCFWWGCMVEESIFGAMLVRSDVLLLI